METSIGKISRGIRLENFESLPKEKISPPPFTFTRPPQEAIAQAKENGHKYIHSSHWVSNLDHDQLDASLSLLRINFPFGFHISLIELPKGYIFSPYPYLFFEGSFRVQVGSERRFAGGRHLTIFLSSECKDCIATIVPPLANRVANQIRLLFGIAAANSLSFESTYEISSGDNISKKTNFTLWSEVAGEGIDLSRMSLFTLQTQSFSKFFLPPDADAMFSRAIDAESKWERFLFLWIAMECILKGGADRKRLFKIKLKSDRLNLELLRLSKIRHQIAHDGDTQVNFHDCQSLLWALRTACTPEPEMQKCIANEYETWLSPPLL